MSETQFVPYPTSKITQLIPARFEDTCAAYALCENGSVWEFLFSRGYRLMSAPPSQPTEYDPPHQPSTQSDDFKEALHWLEVLWHNTYSHEVLGSVLAFLRKHGRVK
jgi:hypothetical protein